MTVEAPFPESTLPPAIRALGDLRGNEYAWRREDLPRVFEAAKAAGLANLGGQVQFRLPDGTCELYWQNFDVVSRRHDEPWDAFVERSRIDVDVALSRLPPDEELVADGLAHFEFLRDQAAARVNIKAALCFVSYFAASGRGDERADRDPAS